MSVGGAAYSVSDESEIPELEFRVLAPAPEEAEEVRLAQSRAVLDILRWLHQEAHKRRTSKGESE